MAAACASVTMRVVSRLDVQSLGHLQRKARPGVAAAGHRPAAGRLDSAPGVRVKLVPSLLRTGGSGTIHSLEAPQNVTAFKW